MSDTAQLESRIQSDCFLWHWNTYPAERRCLFMVYNTPKNAAHGAFLKSMGMVAGVSDMQYLAPDGRVWFLECKRPGEYQSDVQRTFEAAVTQVGHRYRVFTSLAEFQVIIAEAQGNPFLLPI